MLYEFKLGHNACYVKNKGTIDHSNQMVQEISLGLPIKQDQFDLKLQILRLCSKPLSQIWQATLREYQVNLPSHSSVWLITFMYLAKPSRTAELSFTLQKYSKTFDSH